MSRSALQGAEDVEAIRDYVLPLVLVRQTTPEECELESIQGTGFLLRGGRGLGVTAGHVAKALRAGDQAGKIPGAIFWPASGGRRFATISSISFHESQDVALFRIADDDYHSPLEMRKEQSSAPAGYMLFGYPEDTYYERMSEGAGLTPDLVYSEGHLRRSVGFPLPIDKIPGRAFYELSMPAGGGCSGAAVTLRIPPDPYGVIGIYVGEVRNENGTFAVGYAARTDELADQWPELFMQASDLAALCPLPPKTVEEALQMLRRSLPRP
ncbi:trypsin-like peptidase domain-containing protein [Mycobacterium hackensackense]|uniref:hypothetical protein n=1 Tax=Mycobacterium hackensackense TaxID=228909 RepID=UPI002265DE94|nr:hypothetical protein [Mycobacterium hackensackense]MCV7251605.1 trypsin-like peptidase domain-containing protein [Mycobacterium hackensackense]